MASGEGHEGNRVPIVNEPDVDNDNVPNDSNIDVKREPAPYREEPEPSKPSFHASLALKAVQNGWSHKSLRDVLNLLKDHEVLPHIAQDPRTLLGTPRHVTVEKLNDEGTQQYYHFGLKYSLERVLIAWPEDIPDGCVFDMHLSIDGLPVTGSTVASVHPILGRVMHAPYTSDIFCIGIYYGKYKKPDNSHMLLSRFKEEYVGHKPDGFLVHGKRVHVKITAGICDKVERDSIKEVKNHNAYGGCDKCEVDGDPEGHVIYPHIHARLRTDESFVARSHEKHHKSMEPTAFELCGVGMVSQFPLDIMHQVFMGVTKKLLRQWYESKNVNNRIHYKRRPALDPEMKLNFKSCPSEFQRRPRPLSQFRQFKSTEFRSFLLYLGPVIMQSYLNASNTQYRNFMLLVAGMRILLSDAHLVQHREVADKFLKAFVTGFADIYGQSLVSFNVHAMAHLAEDARVHGNLCHVNAFPFESHLGRMKKQLRRHGWTLNQMVKREHEYRHVCEQAGVIPNSFQQVEGVNMLKLLQANKAVGPLPAGVDRSSVNEYMSCRVNGVRFSTCERDRVVACDDDRIGVIRNILQKKNDGTVTACVSYFRTCKEFYDYPLCFSRLGLTEVKNLRGTVQEVDLRQCRKVWLVHRTDGRQVAVELLHNYF